MLATSVQAWTAVGQFVVAAVALLVAFGSRIVAWYRRPVLRVETGIEPPLAQMVHEPLPTLRGGPLVKAFELLRVRVANTGRTPALGVRAEVARWWWEEVEHMQHTQRWHVRVLAGFDLPWTRQGPKERGGASEVKVAPGSAELLDLATYGLNAKMSLVPWNPGRFLEDFNWHVSPYPIGEYRAEIRVVSDNAKPVLQTVLFEATMQAAGFARCEESEPIEDAVVDSVQDLTR